MFDKITIIGAGYVGFSLAVLFSQEKEVTLFDIDASKLRMIDANKSPIRDQRIEEFLVQKELHLKTSDDLAEAIVGQDLIVLALPTNFNESSQFFDTSQIDLVISKIIKKIPAHLFSSNLPCRKATRKDFKLTIQMYLLFFLQNS
ncbi:MAG: hypothetical protein ABS13_07755 [SAR86 cluster bacterium BACL1 MAG-121128-bin56]|nr:MAG: hypothetical protein ABS13_07755 [SAR86 cluster bacterium BACL1 MAG-121128-bin56]